MLRLLLLLLLLGWFSSFAHDVDDRFVGIPAAYGDNKEKFCGAVDWLIKLIPIYRRTKSGTVTWVAF